MEMGGFTVNFINNFVAAENHIRIAQRNNYSDLLPMTGIVLFTEKYRLNIVWTLAQQQ